MNNMPKLMDLYVFCTVVRRASFISAANELGSSAAFISKRIQILEKTMGSQLLHRSTRKVSLTDSGEQTFLWAQQILNTVDEMREDVSSTSQHPQGSIRITSSFGFGRCHVAPVLAELSKQYPSLDIRFDVIDAVVDLVKEGIDLDIRIGNEIAPHLIAKKLFGNQRILAAAPSYLAEYGTPKKLSELAQHQCLVIKERDHPFGIWRLNHKNGEQSVKVSGRLAANNGEMVRLWALAGHGIMLRSIWDVSEAIKSGELIQVLPEYRQDADIWAVYPSRLTASAKLRVCVEFIADQLNTRLKPLTLDNA